MNKFLLLSGLLLCFAPVLSAQWSLGVKAGLNRSNMEISSSTDLAAFEAGIEDFWTDARIDFHAGLMGAYAFSDKVALRGELLYSTKGFRSDGNSMNTDDAELGLHYLSLPILLDYQPLPKLHLVAGPSFSYQLSQTSAPATASPFLESISDNTFDFSLVAGLEYGIGEHLRLGLRYVYGLSGVGDITYTDENAEPLVTDKYHNRSLQISAMFWL